MEGEIRGSQRERQHHVEEEEGEIWTKAQEVFDEAEAEKLGEAFVAEKERRMAKFG